MKKILIVMMVLSGLLLISACSNTSTPATSDDSTVGIIVDKEAKTITIQAEVNGKYFTESTRHGIVYSAGSNGEKSVLRGLNDEKEFYNALLEIGAVAGDNVTMDNMKAKNSSEGVAVAGSKLNVFVTWEGLGKEIPFADIITATDVRPMDIRFGGNLEAAQSNNTGCILCLDSCAVGITSNAAYPTGTTQNKEVDFYGNADVLPNDGTQVNVIFHLVD